jgi:hypothetical protein
MPYTKMRLEYFQLIETLLQYNVFIKITIDFCKITDFYCHFAQKNETL